MSIKIEGSKGNVYDVDWNSCTCPHFKFRCKKEGEICKHIEMVRNSNPNLNPNQIKNYDLSAFDKFEIDNLPFTEEEIDDMIKRGLIFFDRKKLKYEVLK